MVKIHDEDFLYSTNVFYCKYWKGTSLNLPSDCDFSKPQPDKIVDLIVLIWYGCGHGERQFGNHEYKSI